MLGHGDIKADMDSNILSEEAASKVKAFQVGHWPLAAATRFRIHGPVRAGRAGWLGVIACPGPLPGSKGP